MKSTKIIILTLLTVVFVAGCTSFAGTMNSPAYEMTQKMGSTTAARDIGYSVGGAKDVNNFRENINNGYMPVETDLTYEGLFYDYYFDTGETEQCFELFCPSYSYAVTKDPFSKEDDYYLSVGLNSGITDFQRKKLNLVVVLDISGSMGSPFNRYYYDNQGNYVENEEYENSEKIKVAEESIVAMLEHLNDDDRLGIVLFDTTAEIEQPLTSVGDIDMNELKGRVLAINDRGGTDMSEGMRTASGMYASILATTDPKEYENRIIFLTDAMPNTGDTSSGGLFGMVKANSDARLYTTFVGIGVDFGTELIEEITKIKGANYYSVHSSEEFRTRMDDEFEYMVTPLVFNLLLRLDATGYDIEKVYGSPEANEATGELMKVNTLFPSEKTDEGTRGGIVILKLRKVSSDASMKLKVSYENRDGVADSNEENIVFTNTQPEFFGNIGIRKGILLSRYADVLKNWVNDERNRLHYETAITTSVNNMRGIPVPPRRDYTQLSEWERQSMPLAVSDSYKAVFRDFKSYFQGELNAIGDNTLQQEVNLLDKLINA